jgi:hypothetical protein
LLAFAIPPPRLAEFPVTATLLRLRSALLALRIPPPSPGAFPPRAVRPLIRTVGPLTRGSTWNTRSAPSPSTTVFAVPLPVIVRSSVMSRSPVSDASSPDPGMPSVNVPTRPNVIVSSPGRAFASSTAARRVHCPAAVAHVPSPRLTSTASPKLSTWKVVWAATSDGLSTAASAIRIVVAISSRRGKLAFATIVATA